MRIYKVFFKKVESKWESAGQDSTYWIMAKINGKDERFFLSKEDKENGLLLPGYEIQAYMDYGGGISKLELVGELSDKYFNPIISPTEFVEEYICSKTDGKKIGIQV